MEFFDLSLAGLKIVTPKVHRDPRGYFFEHFRTDEFNEAGIGGPFPQENHSYSQKNTLRGMHLQPGQAKLVSVAAGSIYDVAVDLRPDSPTFRLWQGVYLNDEEHKSLYIPDGFAHGFCVLSEDAHVIYKVSATYSPSDETGFRYDDAEVGISWPVTHPILSERDVSLPSFRRCTESLSVAKKG